MKLYNAVKRSLRLLIWLVCFSGSFTFATNLSVPEDFVKESSARVESKIDALIQKRFGELVNQIPDASKQNFLHGNVYLGKQGLVWQRKDNQEVVLVKNQDFEEGHTLAGFLMSPDSTKVAYYTSYQGQDLRHWNVVPLKEGASPVLDQPILNRMDGFSWSQKSDGFYYSYFYEKEDVKNGSKPILDVRYRDLKTQEDKVVFNPGLAENFQIADLDGGRHLIAYRLLNPSLGIKTTFSMSLGSLDSNGNYQWESIYPRNQYVGVFLGLYNKKAVLLTSGEGDHYGVSAVDVLKGGQVTSLVSARKNQVLHTADLVDQNLVLQYHTLIEQNVRVEIHSLKDGRVTQFKIEDFGLTPFGNLSRFQFGPGGKVARAVYSDVFSGDHVLEMNLEEKSLKVLENPQELDFNSKKVQEELIRFRSKNGAEITGRLYTRVGEAPSFVFLRYYGWISIKNSPEPREVQMALELGGAYLTVDLPGGGEKGADWFIDGSRNRLKMVDMISEASTYIQKHLGLGREEVVAMGRSWGGLTSLVLAAKHGDNFGLINTVVPVLDIRDLFENSWFGRISHSDFAPLIDSNGDYLLDQEFYERIDRINPVHLIEEIPPGLDLNLFTSGLDDRVDQGGQLEAQFAFDLYNRLGINQFGYHRSIKGSHSGRFYQVLMFSLIKDRYRLEYRPLSLK